MTSQRAQRVGRQVLHEVSNIAERELKDPRVGMVTFTDVRMGPDLRTAHISYSCLGDAETQQACALGLERARSYLRREVGRRLSLRYAPDLRFEFDDSYQRTERISQLLEQSPPSQTSDPAHEDAEDREDEQGEKQSERNEE